MCEQERRGGVARSSGGGRGRVGVLSQGTRSIELARRRVRLGIAAWGEGGERCARPWRRRQCDLRRGGNRLCVPRAGRRPAPRPGDTRACARTCSLSRRGPAQRPTRRRAQARSLGPAAAESRSRPAEGRPPPRDRDRRRADPESRSSSSSCSRSSSQRRASRRRAQRSRRRCVHSWRSRRALPRPRSLGRQPARARADRTAARRRPPQRRPQRGRRRAG